VKALIEAVEGIPAGQQRLFFAGQPLQDGLTQSDHKIAEHVLHKRILCA
jgi:hypothetical protein